MTSHDVTFSTFAPDKNSAGRDSTSGDLRQLLTGLHDILVHAGLSARIICEGQAISVGVTEATRKGPVEFVFRSRKSFERLFRHLRLFNFALTYVNGEMEVRGRIADAIEIADAINRSTDRRQSVWERLQLLGFQATKVLSPQARARFESLEHYSQSADAYELFLDGYMQYTCARFERGSETIEEAQVRKFHFINERVSAHLGPLRGKRHLDIGCGWGGMASYFKGVFGTVSVGNTNCASQMKYARRRFDIDIVFGDFLELEKSAQKFDLITVVGMIEHLTPYRRSQLLKLIHRLLADGGIVYLQCIAKPDVWVGGDAYRLVQQEVFQGHFLEYRHETERRLAEQGFEVLEAYEHGADYGRTTALWAQRVEQNSSRLIPILGARQYRLYLAYLAYGSKLFATGRGSLTRYVLRKSKVAR